MYIFRHMLKVHKLPSSYFTASRNYHSLQHIRSTAVNPISNTHRFTQTGPNTNLSSRAKLQNAIKDYGKTVIVFHVSISLVSLGLFYIAVYSGLDVLGMAENLGFLPSDGSAAALTTGATTFVMAYLVHKMFAPVRIGITLTVTPFLVRYLRRIGVLKVAKNKDQPL